MHVQYVPITAYNIYINFAPKKLSICTHKITNHFYISFDTELSSRYIEQKQSESTIPFGWDDASDPKVMKNIAVNSYNAVS